ncbi:cytochrome c oxidase assembly protein [Pontibacter qinzhouensis]|uniref:Cytochrome c oxidase assembly protein n=1 Tax=Pontibacter qinzhouensis TaxID=2603253 RepID=A0A5C8K7Q8_9BACT|nr:cytochrome c oxidase assembly protein [Pontibacter qinzhouensis]TXK45856.1 cytochrome c oxidase assembly protein [Pontibacter qinzhouensis]
MTHDSHQLHDSTFPDWIPLLLLVVVAVLYLLAYYSILNEKGGWQRWRVICFTVGLVLLGIALLPSLMRWAHQDLVGHMVQHLLLGMYGPLFLVLGAPVMLALKALPVNLARTITAILRSRAFFMLSHPVTALLLNMGGMYLLYLTPLYVKSLTNSFLHYLIHFHFLAAGFLFTWSMIGQEPVAKRPAFGIRVFVLFISMAAHAFLSKFMYAYLYPLNAPHSADQIREAAKLMYYWGDLSELLLAIVLFASWYRKRSIAKIPAPSA